jgi:hypothetical protein
VAIADISPTSAKRLRKYVYRIGKTAETESCSCSHVPITDWDDDYRTSSS